MNPRVEQIERNNAMPHLSMEQLGEFLELNGTGIPSAEAGAAQDHLRTCAECGAELENLREALRLFRETTTAYANEQLAAVPRPSLERVPLRRHTAPGLLWAAAGLVAVAGLLPLELHRQQAMKPPASVATAAAAAKAESDEALLDDINQELSASVPSPMQALADPTTASASTDTQTSTPRKD